MTQVITSNKTEKEKKKKKKKENHINLAPRTTHSGRPHFTAVFSLIRNVWQRGRAIGETGVPALILTIQTCANYA